MNKKTKKIIKEFCKWLEAEDRQDWEIERYVEDLIIQIKKEINKKMKRKKKTIRRLNYLDYDKVCFESEVWDLLDPEEQKNLLIQMAIGLKDLRDLFINLAKRISKTSPKNPKSIK
jgi:hypothetical protein